MSSAKAPILLEQVGFSFAPEPANDNGFLIAFGRRLHIEQWQLVHGVDAQTIKSRLRSGWTAERAVSEDMHDTNKRRSDAFEGEKSWGQPGSFTWEHLPASWDPYFLAFMREHPNGATVEVVGAAMGLEDSQCRATCDTALMKLRAAVLDDVGDARDLFCDFFGDDALIALLDRFGATAPDLDSGDGDDECDDREDAGPLFSGRTVRGAA